MTHYFAGTHGEKSADDHHGFMWRVGNRSTDFDEKQSNSF